MIETAESFYGPRLALQGTILPPDRHAEYPLVMKRESQAAHDKLGLRHPEPLVEPSSADIAGAPIAVVVNHGRWLAECPGVGCPGAQIASRDDARFFCTTCGNQFVGGRWLAVIWPDDADAIERALEVRPMPFRNWRGEPVDDLLRDNADPVNGLV